TTEGAKQRAAVQAEIDRAKNAADAAHQAAMDALAQGNAAEARRQFDISSAELQRYHTLDVGIRQQEANTAAKTAGYNIYKDLTDKASNPRNFMEQFFTHRGQAAPANAGQYSNTATGPQGIMPFENWLPNFMSQTLGTYGSSSGAEAASPPAASASSPIPGSGMSTPGVPNQVYVDGKATPTHMFDPSSGAYIGTMSGGQSPVQDPNHPAGLYDPNQPPKAFAGGGSLRMTAPHAIVNMLSGKVAAVAGAQPGRGPQGFVPETAKFSGQAIVNPFKAAHTPSVTGSTPTPTTAPVPTPTPTTTFTAPQYPVNTWGGPVISPTAPAPAPIGVDTHDAIGGMRTIPTGPSFDQTFLETP